MTPRTLTEIERWMVAAITGPEVDAADPERVVTPGPRMSAAERLGVYRSAYKSRLVDCLKDDYPVTAELLGDTFDALADAYIDRHPSTSPNLNWYGRRMSAFLAESALEHRAFVSELAALEWALVEVLHADLTPPLDLAGLSTLPPEAFVSARLSKAEGVRFFRFTHPVNAFFQRARAEDVIGDIPSPEASAVVVYRKDLSLWRMDLNPAMARVLFPIFEGKTIGEALALVEEHGDAAELEETARSLTTWFREWTLAGFFAKIER